MPRLLPPHATLEHLKNEAKALHRAHLERTGDACATLRNVQRFRHATDGQIYAATVALTEVQFALAMDYGFSGWQELRRAVLAMRPGEGYRAETEGKAFILPNCPVGHRESSRFASAFSMALSYLGAPADYVSIVGDSGLAFILQADASHTPYDRGGRQLDIGWWPNDPWGAALRLDFLRDVYGFSFHQLSMDLPAFRADPALHYRTHHEAAVLESLRAGYPVIASAPDVSLAVGFDTGTPPLLGQLACIDTPQVNRLEKYPWLAIVLVESGEPIDRREADREALGFAVGLGRDQVDLSHLPGKSGGARSWRLWAEQLADADLCGPSFYHANVVGNLKQNRAGAAAYLRAMATRYGSPVRESLLRAASRYDDVLARLQAADVGDRESLIGVIESSSALELQAQDAMAEAAAAI
jgi:hypothetical protein